MAADTQGDGTRCGKRGSRSASANIGPRWVPANRRGRVGGFGDKGHFARCAQRQRNRNGHYAIRPRAEGRTNCGTTSRNQRKTDYRPGRTPSAACDLPICLSCQRGRTPCLWDRPSRSVAKRGHLRRSHSSWYETCGLTGTAADQIRAGNQSQDREGAGSRRAADAPWPRRRGDRVKRRAFLTLFGGAAAGWPLAANAQQAAKLPTIGFLGSGTPTSQRTWVTAFVERLREFGWIEGRTITIVYRWAEGRPERFVEIAGEFVQLKVDVIFAVGTEAALAMKEATSVIPIVFPVAGDPVVTGLVGSLARPGGNVTGLSNQAIDLGRKRLEILREVLPGLSRLAIMANAAYAGGAPEMGEVRAATRKLGVELVPLEPRRTEEITPALESLKDRVEALYVVGDPLMNLNRMRINTFALAARLPTMYAQREYVESGGLMSYGPNYPDLNRRAADYVDKILRGTKPGDIPVKQPTKFDLVINLITAKALGIDVPPTLLARADEVIE